MPAGPPPTMQQVVCSVPGAGGMMQMRVARPFSWVKSSWLSGCMGGRARFNASCSVFEEMVMRWLQVLCVGLVGCAAVARAAVGADAASDEARGKAWWAHVQYLADDSMRGRLTGSEDYLKAA